MTTNKTDRISKIEKLQGDLKQTDSLVISQNISGSTYKTASIPSSTHYGSTRDRLQNQGLRSLVYIDQGLVGDGSSSNPLILDKAWVDGLLVRRDNIQFTRVGNRKTRYLPISRTSLFQSSVYMSWVAKAAYVANVEDTGELLVIQPAQFAHSVSIGDWSTQRNLDSLQLIERKIEPAELPPTLAFSGFHGTSYTAGVVSLTPLNTTTPQYWYVDLENGSLKEDAISGLSKIKNGGPIFSVDDHAQNSLTAFRTNTGRYYLVVARDTNWNTDPNLGINIRCFKMNGTGDSATTTEITNWNVSSYAGVFTNQSTLRVSDKFIGTMSDRCELNTSDGAIPAFMATFQQTTRLQVIQNPDNINDVYLVIRREHQVGYGNAVRNAYPRDIVLKLAITAEGVGTAFAIDRYLSNRPSVSLVNNVVTYTNKRETYRSADLKTDESEYMHILSDGSVFLVTDCGQSSKGLIRVRKSKPGWSALAAIDIHAAVISQAVGDDQIINTAPSYKDTQSAEHKLYISSPIKIHMNRLDFVIPAQVLDVSSVINNQTPSNIGNIPHTKGSLNGVTARVVYLYAQYSGSSGVLITTSSPINETLNNALIATYYVPTDNSSPILISQGFSRMGKYRLSYQPQGSSVPVSYDNPAQPPKQYWLQYGNASKNKPTFWLDSSATSKQTSYGVKGYTIYIRVDLNNATQGQQFRMTYEGVDLGAKAWTGGPLIWSTTVNFTASVDMVDQTAILTKVSDNSEVSRSYLTVLKNPFLVDIVNTNGGDDVISDTIQEFDTYIRIRPFMVNVGNSIQVKIAYPNSLGTQVFDTQINQGYPIYINFKPTSSGLHFIIVQDITADPNATSTTSNSLQVYSALQIYNTSGDYNITVPQGVIATFEICGGGAGGGASFYSGGSNYPNGQDGQNAGVWNNLNSIFGTATIGFYAYGGKGGTSGIWGNGSSFSNGQPGDGGDTYMTTESSTYVVTYTRTKGAKAVEVSRYNQQPGGVGTVTMIGTANGGGTGAWGVGDERWSYGGGGGAGGYARFSFRNTYSIPFVFTASVNYNSDTSKQGRGAVGHNGSSTYTGGNGVGSFIVVRFSK